MRMRQQSGFVLILCLAIIAILTIFATHIALRVHAAVNDAQYLQDNIQDKVDLSDTKAEILYRFATTPISIYGLGDREHAISLDNRVYSGSGKSQIQLMDGRGLLNLSYASDQQLDNLFRQSGIEGQQASQLIDTFRDYVDADNLRRLNGAEAEDYQQNKLPAPRNTDMQSPTELLSVLELTPALPEHIRIGLLEKITLGNFAGFNPNTASQDNLTIVPGIDRDIASKIMHHRELEPFADWLLIASWMGVDYQRLALEFANFPAANIRITQKAPNIASQVRYNVSLTPRSDEAPWRIDYYYQLPKRVDTPSAIGKHQETTSAMLPAIGRAKSAPTKQDIGTP